MKRLFRILYIAGFLTLGVTSFTSCSLDPKQSNYQDGEEPIKTADQLLATLNGAYARMTNSAYYGRDIIAFSEARSQYMYSTNATGRFGSVSGATVQPTHNYSVDTWKQIYKTITNANRVLEANQVVVAKNGDADLINFYKGQAYILRALGHFDLVKVYGQQYVEDKGLNGMGVPYKTTTRDANESISRPTVKENLELIFADLEKGIALLEESTPKVSGNTSSVRARINLASAYGFKSRIALFASQFDKGYYDVVITASEKAIDSSKRQVATRAGFIDGYKSEEVMTNSLFELTQTGSDNQFTASLFYVYFTDGSLGYGDLICMPAKVDAIFDAKAVADGKKVEDIRRTVMEEDVTSDKSLRNMKKYTARTSNIRIMRIEEIMLNYAEAALEASNGDKAKALAYVNEIAAKRYLIDDKQDDQIFKTLDLKTVRSERTKELMFEGFNFEDIMRWRGTVSNPAIKGNDDIDGDTISFGNPLLALPIPQKEINVTGIDQNKGY
ncbi:MULTISPECIES: RagB/SusD family nutrient uptake outer membrane protein [unclassified Myroides]|uniref:RagB/SusD family nutrient uptake outer membrane protein n=1 Tax=unclassified Myroides TaxID=2642485 RepID=UPI00310142A2